MTYGGTHAHTRVMVSTEGGLFAAVPLTAELDFFKRCAGPWSQMCAGGVRSSAASRRPHPICSLAARHLDLRAGVHGGAHGRLRLFCHHGLLPAAAGADFGRHVHLESCPRLHGAKRRLGGQLVAPRALRVDGLLKRGEAPDRGRAPDRHRQRNGFSRIEVVRVQLGVQGEFRVI